MNRQDIRMLNEAYDNRNVKPLENVLQEIAKVKAQNDQVSYDNPGADQDYNIHSEDVGIILSFVYGIDADSIASQFDRIFGVMWNTK